MKLYHGTDGAKLASIMVDGLLPRKLLKTKGNFKHTVISNPSAIYLTDAYPFHFAGMFKKGLMIELEKRDLDEKLYPDEDALEQSTRDLTPEKWPYAAPPHLKTMKKRTLYYRKICRELPQYTDASLKLLGTCGYYGVIPPKLFKRVILVDWEKIKPNLKWMALDTMVACLNYKILQERHRALVRWFFGDPVTVEELDSFAQIEEGETLSDAHKKFVEQSKKRVANMVEAMQDRSGIEYITVA